MAVAHTPVNGVGATRLLQAFYFTISVPLMYSWKAQMYG